MSPVIIRLLACYPELSAIFFDKPNFSEIDGDLTVFFNKANKDFHAKVLSDHLLLTAEYATLRQVLHASLSNPNPNFEKELKDIVDEAEKKKRKEALLEEYRKELKDALLAGLVLSRILEECHVHFLCQEVSLLRNQHSTFEFYLSPSESPQKMDAAERLSLERQIRDATRQATWYRLFLNRLKRLIEVSAVLGTGWQLHQDFAAWSAIHLTPIASNVAWLFFVPRALGNCYTLLTCSFPIFIQDKLAKELGFWDLFMAQWMILWREVGNDLPWLWVGLMNCFHFVGVLSPYAPTLTLIFYGHDIIMASARAFVELKRLFYLKSEYEKINTHASAVFQDELDKKILFETMNLSINILIVTGVFIGGMGALSILSTYPLIPLFGAITLVSMSVLQFVIERMLVDYQPKDAPEKIKDRINLRHRLGFFSKDTPPEPPSPISATPNSELKTFTYSSKSLASLTSLAS